MRDVIPGYENDMRQVVLALESALGHAAWLHLEEGPVVCLSCVLLEDHRKLTMQFTGTLIFGGPRFHCVPSHRNQTNTINTSDGRQYVYIRCLSFSAIVSAAW